jgi:hypothetical protein
VARMKQFLLMIEVVALPNCIIIVEDAKK